MLHERHFAAFIPLSTILQFAKDDWKPCCAFIQEQDTIVGFNDWVCEWIPTRVHREPSWSQSGTLWRTLCAWIRLRCSSRPKTIWFIKGMSMNDYILDQQYSPWLFVQGRQEDAEEFLCFLLDGLHEEMVSGRCFGLEKKRYKSHWPCHLVLKEKKQQDEKAANGNGWVEVGPNNKTSNLQVVSNRIRIRD